MIWENDVNTRQKEVEKIIRDYWIKLDKYSINSDGTIDVIGDVKFPRTSCYITQLPLNFNKVAGDFDCSRLSLITLEGCPNEIGGIFDCSYNQLTSLEYAPKKAGCLIFDNTIKSLSTNGQNCKFDEVLMLCRTNIPNVGLHSSIIKNVLHIKSILHYQNYYDVWNDIVNDIVNDDKCFNEEKFDELIADILDGLE